MKKRLRQIEYVKIFSRVSRKDYDRLKDIAKRFGFKSPYQILQYLFYCFLRVADPKNDPNIEPVPDEIQDMFSELSDYEQRAYVKPKRRCSYRSIDDNRQLTIRF